MAGRARWWMAAALTPLLAAAPPSLRFDQVFTAAGEPATLHYTVAFTAGGTAHRMEVWRDRDRRVRRDTDGALTSLAERGPTGFSVMLLDHRRHTITRVSREHLYSLGLFANWFDQGHGLRHPKASYRLTAAAAPPGAPAPLEPCRWYALAQSGHVSRLCWDERARVPLIIMADARPVWRVTAIDRAPVATRVFAVPAHGYVMIDADRDMEGD